MGKSEQGFVTPAAGGQWNSGCYYAITNVLNNVIYSYTIWQTFWSNGSVINYFPAPSHSSTSDRIGRSAICSTISRASARRA